MSQEQDQDKQDFDDAFDEFAGGEPVDEAQPEPELEQEPEQEAPEQEDEPEVEQAEAEPEPVAAEAEGDQGEEPDPLEATRKELETWKHKYNSDLGRQAALQRRIQEQQQFIEDLQKQQAQAPQQAESEGEAPDGSGMSDADWKDLQENFPEIARAMEYKLGSIKDQYATEVNSLREQLVPIQQQQQDNFISTQYAVLSAKHPDYQELVTSDEFGAWLIQQPAPVRNLVESDEASDAVWLLDTYKQSSQQAAPAAQDARELNRLQEKRSRQLSQARSVGTSRSSRSQGNMPPSDDYEAAFEHWANQG